MHHVRLILIGLVLAAVAIAIFFIFFAYRFWQSTPATPESPEAANPLAQPPALNPLENVNPLQDIYKNPFEY